MLGLSTYQDYTAICVTNFCSGQWGSLLTVPAHAWYGEREIGREREWERMRERVRERGRERERAPTWMMLSYTLAFVAVTSKQLNEKSLNE